MLCSTNAMGPATAYVLVMLGVVLGAAVVVAIFVWRKALAERQREQYFASRVNRMARRAT